jgi:hypothetical protein
MLIYGLSESAVEVRFHLEMAMVLERPGPVEDVGTRSSHLSMLIGHGPPFVWW